MKWPLELVSHQPFRFFRPALIFLSYPALKWRARPVLPRLGPARQAGIDAVRTHAHWWPASVLPRVGRGKSPVLHLQRLRTKNGPPAWCCPKYLPVIDRLLWLVSYRREMVDSEVVATSLCQIKSLMPVYCGFESIGIRDRCSPGCLRLERATSLVVPPHGHNWRRRRDSHPLDIRFERPTARLLGARRHKLARSRGLAPRSFGLTDRRVELRIRWSGISVLPRVSLRPKRSGFLSSSCPMADGFHPKPLMREFYQFSRLGAATQHFTIHLKC